MNETINNILNRRSVRSYADKPVPKEYLEQIVQCGMFAANGMGLQPWHFTVVQNKDFLERIAEEYRASISDPKIGAGRRGAGDPKYNCLCGAPAVIIVSGEAEGLYVAVDCGNAVQNMAVAATALGLGSCFSASVRSAFFTEKGMHLRDELGIPEGFVPWFSLLVGYAKGKPSEREKRRQDAMNFVW